MTRNSVKTVCIFLSIILYVIALCLPAAIIPDFERGIHQTHYGFEILITGWMGFLAWQPAWLANLLYIFSLLTYGSKRSYRFGITAFIFAMLSPFILVEKLLIGFYVWLASFAVLLYGNNLHEMTTE
ncbi:hypothetical protein [Legionella pneumophila]